MKKCYTCQLEKSESEFNKNKSRVDKLNSICRECSKQRSKQYYQDNQAKHRKVVRARKKRIIAINQDWLQDYKSAKGCCVKDCDVHDHICLDFHHLDPKQKDMDISKLMRGWSLERVRSEVKKCCVICSNHHRQLHAGRKIQMGS